MTALARVSFPAIATPGGTPGEDLGAISGLQVPLSLSISAMSALRVELLARFRDSRWDSR